MKSGLKFRDFSDKKNPVLLLSNAIKIPKTFRQISESRERKQKFRSKNISGEISLQNQKQKQNKFSDLKKLMTSRSPNIHDKDKENVDDQSMKHSQISIKNENQKGLKFNPNKKGRKHLEQNTKVIKKSVMTQEIKVITHKYNNSFCSEAVVTSHDYSQVIFDMSPTLLKC